MEYLILAYFIISGIIATLTMRKIPEVGTIIKPLIIGLSFPIEIVMFVLYLLYKVVGINLHFGFSIKITEKEQQEMTDAFLQNLSDELKKMEENIQENDEK